MCTNTRTRNKKNISHPFTHRTIVRCLCLLTFVSASNGKCLVTNVDVLDPQIQRLLCIMGCLCLDPWTQSHNDIGLHTHKTSQRQCCCVCVSKYWSDKYSSDKGDKKVQLTQRQRATALHVKNGFGREIGTQGHSRSFILQSTTSRQGVAYRHVILLVLSRTFPKKQPHKPPKFAVVDNPTVI